MDFNELKHTWDQSGESHKSQKELSQMSKIKNHPQLRHIRVKLIIETVLLVVFLLVYYDAFDGGEKPFWANMVLVGASILYILNDLLSYFLISNPVKEGNLKQSLSSFYDQLKRIRLSSLLVTFLFGSSLFLFFLANIDFSSGKFFILGGMIGTMLVFLFLENKTWTHWIGKIKLTLGEFEEEKE